MGWYAVKKTMYASQMKIVKNVSQYTKTNNALLSH